MPSQEEIANANVYSALKLLRMATDERNVFAALSKVEEWLWATWNEHLIEQDAEDFYDAIMAYMNRDD